MKLKVPTFTNIIMVVYLLLIVGGGNQIYRSLTDPPYEYTSNVYYPKVSQLCPGDLLEFHTEIIIRTVPTQVTSNRTIWSVEKNTTVFPDKAERAKVFIWTHANVRSPRDWSEVVPDLPAGRYEWTSLLESNSRKADYFVVPFTIKKDCQK